MALSLNATLEANVCSCTDGHSPNRNLSITSVTCGQSQHGYSTRVLLLLATTAPQQEIPKCYHWDILQRSFLHRLWAHKQCNWRHKTSLNEGEVDKESERKPRLADIAISIYITIIICGAKDAINFILKCLINRHLGCRLSKNRCSWYFPSCQLITQPQKLPNTQHMGARACSVHFLYFSTLGPL